MARITGLLLTLVLTTPLWGAEVAEVNEGKVLSPLQLKLGDGYSPPSTMTGELLVKTLVSLVLVIGLGLGAAYVTKRVMPRFGLKAGKDIRVLETVGLGPRKALHLVQVGAQRLLIGSTPESITMLSVVRTGFNEVMDAHLEGEEESL